MAYAEELAVPSLIAALHQEGLVSTGQAKDARKLNAADQPPCLSEEKLTQAGLHKHTQSTSRAKLCCCQIGSAGNAFCLRMVEVRFQHRPKLQLA